MRAVSRSPKRIDNRYSAAPRGNSSCPIWIRRARMAASVLGLVIWELIYCPESEIRGISPGFWGGQSCLQEPAFRPAGPAGKRVRSQDWLPHMAAWLMKSTSSSLHLCHLINCATTAQRCDQGSLRVSSQTSSARFFRRYHTRKTKNANENSQTRPLISEPNSQGSSGTRGAECR